MISSGQMDRRVQACLRTRIDIWTGNKFEEKSRANEESTAISESL